MVIQLLILYIGVAVVSALICAFVRRELAVNVFVANLILGSVMAWVGGLLFGPVGPLVYGVPVLACFGLALPALFSFNALMIPATEATVDNVIELRPGVADDFRRAM